MSEIRLETLIHAPAEVCFDLMRDIRVHPETAADSGERAVAGVTDGMIGLGQTVSFEGRHFGINQRLRVQVTEFERPRRFVDAMVEGRFAEFFHVHEFEPSGHSTLMRDTLIWSVPYGLAGRLFDVLLLRRHLEKFVRQRNSRLKELAESAAADSDKQE